MGKEEKLISALKKKKLSLALAESCSGGYVSYSLTKTPGASKVFKGSIVVYSLSSKNKFFNISPGILKKTQGVSEDIAITLAKKVKKKFDSDVGASIVGFAGPGAKKGIKVGTVFIGLSIKAKCFSKKIIIKGTRDQVRKRASSYLIDLLYKNISAK